LIVRERVQLLSEPPALIGFLFEKTLEYDSSLLQWKTQSVEEAKERLLGVREWLAEQSEDVLESIEKIDQGLRAFVVQKGWGNGDTLWPTRVALSGQKQSPSPFELIFAYGKERALARLDEAIVRLA
jgi:glutamyl/glutaminyl-tRNA synthetase